MPDPSPHDVSLLERREVGLAGLIARMRERPWVKRLGKAAELGDQEPLYMAAAVLTGMGLGARRPGLVRAGVRMAAAIGAADALKSVAKRVVARSRPRTVIDDDRYVSRPSDGGHGKDEQSFPSGHVACSLAAGVALCRINPALAPATIVILCGLGLARVLKGDHWPSDVAAGAVIGLAAEALTGVALTRMETSLGSDPARKPVALRNGLSHKPASAVSVAERAAAA